MGKLNNMIKVVVFDFDGTLINEDQIDSGLKYSYKQNKNRLGNISQNTFLDANKQAFISLLKLYKSRKIILSQFSTLIWFETLNRLHIPNTPTNINKLYKSLQQYIVANTILNEGVIEVFSFLKKNGYKIGILSNGLFKERINKIRKVKIEEFIDVIVTTDMVGKDKPDVKPFKYLLGKFNIKPHEAIYVGNSQEEDISGAKRAKIKTIWYTNIRNNKYLDYNVNNLTDIIPIIKKLSG